MTNRRGLVAAVLGGLLALLVHPIAASADTVKYYLVGTPLNGQREYLYEIAAKTLGGGKRAQEIFELNKDRVQPDGGRLTDPLELHTGWILILPADADGPGVRTGPLPQYTPAATEPSTAPSRPPVSPSPTPEPPPAGDRSAGALFGLSGAAQIRIGSVVLMVLFAALALAFTKKVPKRRRPVPAPVD